MVDKCEHHDICSRDALEGHNGLCILHSENSQKDTAEFKRVLEKHQAMHGPNFEKMVFPADFNFETAVFVGGEGPTFEGHASFVDSTFEGEANFLDASFEGMATFSDATFNGGVTFGGATFKGMATFWRANFKGKAIFVGATFKDMARFEIATFENEVTFVTATFENMAHFGDVVFGGKTTFWKATFESKSLFAGTGKDDHTRVGRDIVFTGVEYSQNAPPQFRGTDLRCWRFLGTNVQYLDFTGVQWCKEVSSNEWFSRVGVYDEVAPRGEREGKPWSGIERLYRQLKKNYEDRGDFSRAGDFHIGEKEARRQNPSTSGSMYLLLSIYRALSKYGERALPATFWLLGVVVTCAAGYFLLGASFSEPHNTVSGVQAFLLSLEATFFPFGPGNISGEPARALNLFQRLVSPPLLALLALALRQRVKR